MTKWNEAGRTAVVTGGASGIGLAAATQFLRDGLNVVIADRDCDALDTVTAGFARAGTDPARFLVRVCDVSKDDEVTALRDETLKRYGAVHCLMNNAGAGGPAGLPWENLDAWKRLVETNLWGVIRGCQAFVPTMLEAGEPGVIVNTGSKQGITKPPGNYAYNLSKAGVLAYSECLSHALRQVPGCPLTAHLLVPGFTYTGMISRHVPNRPAGAWSAEQVVEFMMASLARDEFYILCPDNDVPRAVDEKRIQWAADDLIKNRPALSRWHPDFADAYAEFMNS